MPARARQRLVHAVLLSRRQSGIVGAQRLPALRAQRCLYRLAISTVTPGRRASRMANVIGEVALRLRGLGKRQEPPDEARRAAVADFNRATARHSRWVYARERVAVGVAIQG